MADVTAVTGTTPSSSTPASFLPFNLPILSAFMAFALAQFLKIFTTWYKKRKWDSERMLDSGGTPSSHSDTESALVVMYAASGVRLHAGRQAELLNQIVCELPRGHPLSNASPLRDSLGHTPLQVVSWDAL